MDVRELTESVAKCFAERAKKQASALLILKVTVVIFSCAAGMAQFMTVDEGKPWSTANFVGIGASIIVALAGLFFAIADRDASDELELARQAVVRANDAERELVESIQEFNNIDVYLDGQKRSNNLYQAMMSLRGAIERIIGNASITEDKACQLLLEVSERSIEIALGVSTGDHFTVCIYSAKQDADKKTILKCVAHFRALPCALEDARVWPIGVGVGGAAFARGTEVIVPDLQAEGVGTLYAFPNKEGDVERYRSIVAVPVIIDEVSEPWGVVVGTSDVPRHFSIGTNPGGVQTAEPIRALAAMAALAVRVARSNR